MDDGTKDLEGHLRGIGIRVSSQVGAGRANAGSAILGGDLWALREVRWRGAGAVLLHDARGTLPVLPRQVVARARRDMLWVAA